MNQPPPRKSFSGQASGRASRYVKGTAVEKPPNNEEGGLRGILIHPLNLLMIFLPAGIVAYYREWSVRWIFWPIFFAMVPLAKILGDATEELAASLKNDMLAGLLNATFGNAVEMVITIQTLRAELYSVVKATLLGSVLSNTLLVLGMSFFCGGVYTMKKKDKASDNYSSATEVSKSGLNSGLNSGLREVQMGGGDELGETMGDINVTEKIQSFSVLGALVNTSMLLISCMSFSLITVFRQVTNKESDEYIERTLLPVSRISSIIIMMAYIAYILFQLVTHKDAMADEGDDDDDGEEAHMSVCLSISLLFGTTVIIAYASELLVHAIEGMTAEAHLGEKFIGIILLPIVGNACEHAAAVRFAMQDKLGLSVGIAVGSSTQIALFVVPFSVLVGWSMNKTMDLDFGCLNTSMITLSVIVVLSMVVDGTSNWLQGYLLMSVYAIVAVMYWYLPDDAEDHIAHHINQTL